MIKIALVRGRYLNNFEGQNFQLDKKRFYLVGISSLLPLDSNVFFPILRLPCLADIQKIKILEKPIKFIANRTLGDSQILFGLEKYAQEFDIFHSADSHYFYTYQLAKLKDKNKIKKLIISSWETIPFNNEKTWAKKKIKYYSLEKADLFLCYTRKARDALIEEGVNETKIKLVKLGVDLTKFKPVKKGKRKSITILFVGRLVWEKGVMDLFQSYLNLKKLGFKNLKLNFIGQGSLEDRLKRKIKEFGLIEEIEVKSVDYENIPFEYQKGEIFVLPSKRSKTWEEQYGMVLIEAMASGLPIIASLSGAIPEIVDKAGLYFQQGDVDGLTDQLIKLIKDINLRSKLAKIGRKRTEDFFDCRKTAKKIEEIYQQLLNQ